MFLHRLKTSIMVAAFVIAVLVFAPAWAFALLVASFIVLAMNELFLMMEKKGFLINRKLGMGLGVVVALSTYFDYKIPFDWFYLFIPAICFVIFIVQFTKKDKAAILSISSIFFGLVYVSWFLSFFIRLRIMPEIESVILRKYLIFYLVLVTKSGDIGAYLIGSKFGKHKLIPRISPKKTVEGLIGGLIFTVIVSLMCKGFLPDFSFLRLFILGIILGVLANIGDLSESLIKRDCAVKDSGSALPGLGGILDSIDSLLFTAPVFYFYVKVFLK